MRVKQRLNNNVVLVENEFYQPIVVMGKGIGYKAYPGNPIDESLIEHTFILKNHLESDIAKVSTLIEAVPIKYIVISDDIIKLCEEKLQTEFGLGMLVSLADHLFSAVNRQKKDIQLISPLHWDIKQLYPVEFNLGEEAVAYVNQKMAIKLDETEATAIAMHFISNENNYESIQQVMHFTKTISDIVSIIQYHFQFEIDQNTLNFSRLVTHLQYFLMRQAKGIKMMEIDEEMIRLVIRQYQASFQCAEKIIKYLNENQNVSSSLEEEIYLTMHIERVRCINGN